jgi:hypothetical protein
MESLWRINIRDFGLPWIHSKIEIIWKIYGILEKHHGKLGKVI